METCWWLTQLRYRLEPMQLFTISMLGVGVRERGKRAASQVTAILECISCCRYIAARYVSAENI